MKKIFFLLTFVLGCASAQAQVIQIYKNGTLEDSYYSVGDNDYKVVVKEGKYYPGDGKTHETVDLGLSVKWATCNVGASSATDVGSCFAWGETEALSYDEDREWTNYKYSTAQNNMTKYNPTDSLTVLEPEDDAATVIWGSFYRTPTQAEFKELVDSCTWTWDDTKRGYTATSKINGNSIFFPAAGEYFRNQILDKGTKGHYWTSTLGGSTAYELYFNTESWNFAAPQISSSNRSNGMPVRPVEKP